MGTLLVGLAGAISAATMTSGGGAARGAHTPMGSDGEGQLQIEVTSVEFDDVFGSKEPGATTVYPLLGYTLYNNTSSDIAIASAQTTTLGYQLQFDWSCGKHRVQTEVYTGTSISMRDQGDSLIPAGGCMDFKVLLVQPLRIHHDGTALEEAIRNCVVTVGIGSETTVCNELKLDWPEETEPAEVKPVDDELSIDELKEIIAELLKGEDQRLDPAVRVPVVGEETRLPVRLSRPK